MNITEKIQKRIAAAGEFKPGVAHIEVKHDAGCPTITSQSLADCTCDPVFKVRRPDV